MRDNIKVEVDDIEVFDNEKYKGLKILWAGNIGFGEYTIFQDKKDNKWYAESECMDKQSNKGFLNLLVSQLIDNIQVIE